MPKVLILGARAPVALDHARRFAHQGWSVVVADSASCRLSAWSQAVSACVRLPSPRWEPDAFARALAEALRQHRIDLVLPTCEEVFHLARHRVSLPESVRVATSDLALLDRLHSKWQFLELARECGIAVPASARVTTLDQARHWAGEDGVVLKPEYSRFGTFVRLYRQGIAVDAPELEPVGAWVVQRFCEGRELCSYSIADRGRLLAHVVYRPVYRLAGSASFWFESQTLPAIDRKVAALIAHTGFTGQIAFDWIESPEGDVWPIECNPRAVSGVHLFGLDDALPAALMGEAIGMLRPSSSQPCMLGSVMATAGAWQAWRQGRWASWREDHRRARDVVALRGDRRPMWGGLFDMASLAGMARRQRLNLRQASTHDIEWDGLPA
ncbi:ATP-grasp domain-containing protein [Dyella sp.]|uniref:ATP-grasp domain-containing protein n=1 Tax=Dyella sp. TaxID=1869338 RepID=UPI002ED24886